MIRILLLSVVLLASCPADTAPDPPADPPVAPFEPSVPPLHPEVDDLPEAVVLLVGPDDEHVRVDVKVAETRDARRHGLTHVDELPAGVGMLFAYPTDRRGTFWMLDVPVPLDIAFFDGDDRLTEVIRMEPCAEEPCPLYRPSAPYRRALEVRADWFAERGVGPGWRIEVRRTDHG